MLHYLLILSLLLFSVPAILMDARSAMDAESAQ